MATSDEQMSTHRPRAVVLLSSEPRAASETALVPRGFAARPTRVLSNRDSKEKQETARRLVTTYKALFASKNSSLIRPFCAWVVFIL